MAKIVQMELAFAGACAPDPSMPMSAAVSLVVDTVCALDAAAYRQGIADCFSNPCKDCPYFGLCDADDCAMHLFDLDVNDPDFDC